MTAAVVVAPCSFTALVQDFFQRYLPIERNLRRNTLLSYRDGIKLFLRFLSESEGCSPDAVTCEVALDADRVRGYLRWLADVRHCGASTRNQRLAALRAFARYVAARAPEHLDRCRRVREIPLPPRDRPAWFRVGVF